MKSERIQIALNKKLLKAADKTAKRQHVSRSALIREALQRHLNHRHELQLEEQDRRGYLAKPQLQQEYRIWEAAASWSRY